jgi:hypothetical protein
VGNDADHTAQDLRNHTVASIAVDHPMEPGPASFML